MNKSSMNFVKGMSTGIAAGAVIATVGRMVMKKNPSIAKSTSKAVRAVGDFVDGIQSMMK